jgi:hypothetical protein
VNDFGLSLDLVRQHVRRVKRPSGALTVGVATPPIHLAQRRRHKRLASGQLFQLGLATPLKAGHKTTSFIILVYIHIIFCQQKNEREEIFLWNRHLNHPHRKVKALIPPTQQPRAVDEIASLPPFSNATNLAIPQSCKASRTAAGDFVVGAIHRRERGVGRRGDFDRMTGWTGLASDSLLCRVQLIDFFVAAGGEAIL